MAAKQRGMRVLIDLVVNHTSDQHPWFQDARRDPASRYRDWYVWSKKKPRRQRDEGMVFPGVQKTTWTRDPSRAASGTSTASTSSSPISTPPTPRCRRRSCKIMGFWLQLGVSGFRMDAVPFVIAKKGPDVAKPVEQYDMLRSFREFLQWRRGRGDHPRGGQRAAGDDHANISATTATACR